MGIRGHQTVDLSNTKGLWRRGDEAPPEYLSDCNNIQFKGNDFGSRDGLGISQTVAAPIENIFRMYNYPTQNANTLLVLTIEAGVGTIYHVVDASTVFQILQITGMTDFAFVPYAGRAYISPFISYTNGDLVFQKGMQNESLYVYAGDGTNARAAAGATPAGTLTIANGAAGNTDPGLHVFGVVGETDSGFLSQPIALNTFVTTATNSVSFGTVPIFVGPQWVKRHIVASTVVASFNGNLEGYPLFFIPNGTINDNVSAFLNNVSFFDDELLDDASHLFDNYQTIPAGAALSIYHDRLCLSTTYDDISLVLVSAQGEPEAISQADGLIIVPPDGNPITNHAELRDVFYVFKRSRNVAYIDNGEEPSNWPMSSVDNSYGTSVHGIATVLDSGKSTVDFLVVATYAGILLFNGKYILPELSWTIEELWSEQERNDYNKIQIINVPSKHSIYVVLPDSRVLVGNYENGFDPKNIRWTTISFLTIVNAIAVVNVDEVIIGCENPNPDLF